jgi:hypothetical protein
MIFRYFTKIARDQRPEAAAWRLTASISVFDGVLGARDKQRKL